MKKKTEIKVSKKFNPLRFLKNIDWEFVFTWVIIIFFILVLLTFIGLQIYALIAYGGKPADEIPGWVWWLWNKSKN